MNYQEMNGLYLKLFIEILKKETKPEGFSKTVYLTMLAIRVLEQIGNRFPTQAEIDVVESILKRFSNRKTVKPIFTHSCHGD